MIGSFCFYISNKHFNLTIMKKIFLSLAFLFGIGMSVWPIILCKLKMILLPLKTDLKQ